MSFAFGTKGETLARLKRLVVTPRLCPQIIFSVSDWSGKRERLLGQIIDEFGNDRIVVRSSTMAEDGWDASMAGAYLSVTNLDPNPALLANAIERVIDSYDSDNETDQVLIQPYVQNVVISGVVMTRDLQTGGPYYVINYDDRTGRTDSVTSGAESKIMLVHRSRPEAVHSPRIRKLIKAVIEIEQATDCDELDIEFCITRAEDVYLLQARPMAARKNWDTVADPTIDTTLDRVRETLTNTMKPADGLAGDTTVFGEMSDWNPAEMIGNTPKPLALSLYQNLITNHAWAKARASMGYRSLTSRPLMVSLAGRPFVDIRLSLNSFLPASLDPAIANRLVSHQLKTLSTKRDLHDKIEFEIAITCTDFAHREHEYRLRDAGLNSSEIDAFKFQLLQLTNALVVDGPLRLSNLAEKTQKLDSLRKKTATTVPAKRIQALLNDSVPYGTIPFAELARHAFIGVALLKSLEQRDVFDTLTTTAFLQSVNTVAGELVFDTHALTNSKLAIGDFLERYGHLRPGTYDITSDRYADQPELYLGQATKTPPEKKQFTLSDGQRTDIDLLLAEAGLKITVDHLLDYVTEAVRMRELAKFRFTRGVSDILETIKVIGARRNISPENLAFLRVEQILQIDDPSALHDAIATSKEAYRITRTLRLPHIITCPDDIDVVRLPLGHPTYITQKRAAAQTTTLMPGEVKDIEGKIVLIESADPGFDWIFSHALTGLVTKYGGANSHMAIRCAEFGLPAAIGCGERLFDLLSKGRVIEMDCATGTIRATGI